MTAGQLAVGNGDDLVGVIVQLVQGDLVIRAENVSQKIHNEHIVPFQFLFHGSVSFFLYGGVRYISDCWAASFASSSSSSTR